MSRPADWSNGGVQHAISAFIDSLEDRLNQAGPDSGYLDDTGPIDWSVAQGRGWDAVREVVVTDVSPDTARSILAAGLQAGMRVNWRARDSVLLEGPYETLELWCPMTVHDVCSQAAAFLLDPGKPDATQVNEQLLAWCRTGELGDHVIDTADDARAQEYLTVWLTDALKSEYDTSPDRRILAGHMLGSLSAAVAHVWSLGMVDSARLIDQNPPPVRLARREPASPLARLAHPRTTL